MNNILKRISVLTLLFVLVGLFSTVVSATEVNPNTQTENTNNNVVLSEDEYNDLIERIEELEQLKEEEINNNLFDYYEKTTSDRETGIAKMFDGVAIAVAILLAAAGVVIAINFKEGRNASEKAKETNEKAEDVIDEVNEQLVISKEKVEEMENNLKEYDEQVHDIEKKLLLLDETKNKLDLYIKRASAQTTGDLDLSIKIYTEVVKEMEQLGVEDNSVFYERGNAYLSKFKLKAEIVDTYKCDIETEIRNLEHIEKMSNLSDVYNYLLIYAIKDFEEFFKKNIVNSLNTTIKLKIIECSIYARDYERVFMMLNDINDTESNQPEFASKIAALIIINPNLYEILLKYKKNDNKLFLDIWNWIYMYEEIMFNEIFANELIFDSSLMPRINEDNEYSEKNKEDAYNKLMKKLDSAYSIFNKSDKTQRNSGCKVYLGNLPIDFIICTRVRNGEKDFEDSKFAVFNTYCVEFLYKLDDIRYNKVLDTLTQMRNGEYEIETT